MKLYLMSVQDLQWEYIDLFLFYFINCVDKLFVLLKIAIISIQRDFAKLYNFGLSVAAVYFNCQRENGTDGRRI